MLQQQTLTADHHIMYYKSCKQSLTSMTIHHSHVHCNQYHTYYDTVLDIPYMYEGIQSTYHVTVYITQYKVHVVEMHVKPQLCYW